MVLVKTLAFVVKRVKPGELKEESIKAKIGDDKQMNADAADLIALVDGETGKIKPESATQVRKMASKHPALFSTVDIESFMPEVADEDDGEKKTVNQADAPKVQAKPATSTTAVKASK